MTVKEILIESTKKCRDSGYKVKFPSLPPFLPPSRFKQIAFSFSNQILDLFCTIFFVFSRLLSEESEFTFCIFLIFII